MPIYEYQCQSCSHQLEVIQKFSDEPLVDCPSCGQSRLEKLISASAFRLGGTGWYETDFKTGNQRNLASTGDSESGSSGSSDSTAPATSTSE